MEGNKRSGLKVSSTRIRELFFYSTTSEDTLKAELATLAAKSELLALYMGMDDYSKPRDVVIQGSMPTQIKDNRAFDRRQSAASKVRRASLPTQLHES